MNAPPTLLLSRGEVRRLLTMSDCVRAVEEAFRLHASGRSLLPAAVSAVGKEGGFHVKSAGLRLGRAYFAVKTNGNFFSNRERFGMENIQGTIVLCDGDNGAPLAVLDSIEITILRTGAATAVAAERLARRNARVALVCGCGNQGRIQLRAVALARKLERVLAFDADPERARGLAAELGPELDLAIEPAADLAAAVAESDIVVTATPSRSFYVRSEWIRPGAFIAAVGADSPEKQELDPEILARGRVVCDVLAQCAEFGELHHAVASGRMRREDAHAELAEIVAGTKPARTGEEEIFVFDSTGTALEDVAAAAAVYEKAVAAGAGVSFRIGE